jgi:hypothetical protein
MGFTVGGRVVCLGVDNNHPVSNSVVMANNRKLNVDEIIHLYVTDGLSTVEIARLKNCTPFAVKYNLKQAGVKLRGHGGRRTEKAIGFVPTKEWLVQAIQHFDSAKAAAKHYGIEYSTLIDHLKKHGIDRRRWIKGPRVHGARQDIPIKEAIELSNSGATYQQIASRYGVSYGVINRRMREAKHKAPWRRTKDDRFRTTSFHKRVVLEKLGITACEICGEDRAIDFCHIKPAEEGGLTAKENTLILCPTHHRLYDAGKLSPDEFTKIKIKVINAETLYCFKNGFYGGW